MAVSTEQDFAIVSPTLTVDALRDSGYKSTTHAIAELIDNAVEAKANLIELFCVEEMQRVQVRQRARVIEIAVMDDGCGMDVETLRRSLKFGDGTRRNRQGMGRFGMGLPNSSLSQCTKVTVWSWQNGVDNALRTHLSLEEIKNGMTEVPEPVLDPLPIKWRELAYHLPQSGTLVLWTDLDRVQWAGAAATLENTKALIGRIYRRQLDQRQVTIRLIPVREDEITGEPIDVLPNDPLYLLAPSQNQPPFDKQPMFERFGDPDDPNAGSRRFMIEDIQGIVHPVTVTITIARKAARVQTQELPWPRDYKDPGNAPWGKNAGKNMGVSIMRADRELDLDNSWVSGYDPTDRWWGIEVDFPPALDEVFGVTNDKQATTVFSRMANFDWKDHAEPGETIEQFKERFRAEGDKRAALLDLAIFIKSQRKLLEDRLAEQRRGARGGKRHTNGERTVDDDATTTIKHRGEEGHEGETDKDDAPPEKQKEDQVENLVRKHRFNKEEAEQLVEETIGHGRRTRMVTSHVPSPAFFEVEFIHQVLQVSLNMDHPVYPNLIEVLDEDTEDLTDEALRERLQMAADTFKTMLYAWARYEDENPPAQRTRARDMRWDWGKIARVFLEERTED